MKSLKVSSGIGALKKRVRPFVSMHTAIKIYKGLIEPISIFCSTVSDGLTQQLRRNFKNFKIVLSELSPNQAMIACYTSSRFLLNSLGWYNLSVEGLNKRLI